MKLRGIFDIRAFIVFVIALVVGGLIFNFVSKLLPENITNIQLLMFLLMAIIVFALYTWLVRTLKAPPR